MNVWFLSDLHLEERDYDLRLAGVCPPHVGVLVLAGDIGQGTQAVGWMNEQQAEIGVPIVYVHGNHDLMDFYGTDMSEIIAKMKARAAPDVHILDNERVELGGVHFLGTTLWTDLSYSDPPGRSERDIALSISTFPDFSSINVAGGELLTAEAWVALHQEARDWLESELLALRDQSEGPRVVVTHHLPHPRSLDPRFAGSDTDAAFCSRLPDALLAAADVWIHGHSHHAQDWIGPGGVRVVSNPLGYPGDTSPGFDFVRWVEV